MAFDALVTWSPERLRHIFRAYADVDFAAAGAHLYAAIGDPLASDDDVLALSADVRPGQPPPNLLFAAVHALLLSATEHSLARYYPDLTPEPLDAAGAYLQFRDFCLTHRDRVVDLVRTRLVQTNVLERCGLLLPAFATAGAALSSRGHRDDLALIEIGASAGLNLMWERYAYNYGGVAWGSSDATVQLEIDVRGDVALPAIPGGLHAAWSRGIDLNPVDLRDADALLWQRALMWPERRDRQHRLEQARAMMAAARPEVIAGDACALLPGVLNEAPADLPLCVFASYTLYQFSAEARATVIDAIAAGARTRPIALITIDIKTIGDAYGTVEMTIFDGGTVQTTTLARGHPHGNWIEWLS